MAFSHGKNTRVAINGYNLSSYFNDSSASATAETAQSSTYGSSAHTYVVGLTDGTLSLRGIFDGSTDAVDQVLQGIIGTDDGGYFLVCPVGDGNGNRCYFGLSEETSYEVSSPLSDVVGVSAEFQVDGGVNHGLYLRDAGTGSAFDTVAAGATEETTGVDNGASTADGGVAQVHVAGNTLSGTLTVKVQDSPDNLAWADLASFTVVTAGTETAEQVTVAGTVDRYLRSSSVAVAGTGSAEVAVAFKRN